MKIKPTSLLPTRLEAKNDGFKMKKPLKFPQAGKANKPNLSKVILRLKHFGVVQSAVDLPIALAQSPLGQTVSEFALRKNGWLVQTVNVDRSNHRH